MGFTGMIYVVTMVFSLIVLILFSSTVGFDYFQFTQQYQPAVCNFSSTPCKDPPDKLFTVHGLWPSNAKGNDPEGCKTQKYQKMQTLEPQLEIIWPNVYNRTANEVFWRKQWYKHGSCASPPLQNQTHYFDTVIKMYRTQKQNVSYILSRANIEPKGEKRALVDIENAIRSGTNNKAPKLKCQTNARMTALVEVTLCSDSNLTQFINCPRPFPPGSPFICPTDNIQY
uniref:S42-RNase n=4 Tax=Pyrus TaxID=3766 RepID=A7LA80_9ROSA|nr:S42-RNase [Pyrus x bretschneideri]